MSGKHQDVERIMLSRAEISERIKELAARIDIDYVGKKPVMVCILKGSVIFFSDLIREMQTPVEIDFMVVSSYGSGTVSTRTLNVKKDLVVNITGRDVLIVEDIVDSGNTLFNLKKLLETRSPASLKVVTLLDKPERRQVEMTPEYRGFEIEDEFVVGYGLDYAEEYRNLPYVGVLKHSVYEK